MSKDVPNVKRPSTKPEKVVKESMRKRVKKGYVAKSSPKDAKGGKIYDTTEDKSPMTLQKGRAKKSKRGEV